MKEKTIENNVNITLINRPTINCRTEVEKKVEGKV